MRKNSGYSAFSFNFLNENIILKTFRLNFHKKLHLSDKVRIFFISIILFGVFLKIRERERERP